MVSLSLYFFKLVNHEKFLFINVSFSDNKLFKIRKKLTQKRHHDRKIDIFLFKKQMKSGKKIGFTLIELLIVVAIIAILAAIAVPNFLEAQTRSKVSRAKADMRSIAVAIEAYSVDSNAYPPGYKTAPNHSFFALTTPIAYITNGYPIDPFRPLTFAAPKANYTYELMNANNKVIQQGGGAYGVDPKSPGNEPYKGVWWWICSRGPNNTFGLKNGEPEFDLTERFYKAVSNPELLLMTVYDPSNGTISNGNIYKAGGAMPAAHAQILN